MKIFNKKGKTIQTFVDDVFTPIRSAHELGIADLKETLIDKPFNEFRDHQDLLLQKYIKQRNLIAKKYKTRFKKNDTRLIGEHLLALKDRGTGIGPLMAYLENRYPGVTKDKMLEMIEAMKSDSYLNDRQKELVPVIKDIFDTTADMIEPVYEKDQMKIFLRFKNYFPVIKNHQLIEKTPESINNETSIADEKELEQYAIGIRK